MFNRIRQNGREFGFGRQSAENSQRILNRDGSFNVERTGLVFWEKFSIYHWLTNSPLYQFLLFVLLCYFLSGAFFAGIYTFILGPGQFHGIETTDRFSQYLELFFFSTQTFATVGYGRINPATNPASFVAAIDAITGVLYFAIVTGLFYGRFSKPVTKVLFSEKAVVSPYRNGMAIMFRIANKLNHQLQNAEIRIIGSGVFEINGEKARQFFELELERHQIVFLATSWTIVHPLEEKSPFFGLTEEEFFKTEPEFMLQLKVYDQEFSQDTFTNSSYRRDDIVWQARFEKVLTTSPDGRNRIDFENFNKVVPV